MANSGVASSSFVGGIHDQRSRSTLGSGKSSPHTASAYFASDWEPPFIPLLEMSDPGLPAERGALLVAQVGEGRYIYTGLSFFRQLPAGVPGAIRLFVNLLATGRS